ncbi:MAG TPA: hypothetical protein DCE41_13390 [Cytophagales bacterium]|nr:hypothetical protein [Cytophagales bacterium]HAA22439.1 hypothetical protein [Cytophagales bacterium]HAP59759.1 hypothetical protein [Cytophagales bacterium]
MVVVFEMKNPHELILKIRQDVDAFWHWALELWPQQAILNGEIDAPSYPKWHEIEAHLEQTFLHLNFEEVPSEFLDHILFLIAQQWDIGTILSYFHTESEEISQLGMNASQLMILGERGLTFQLIDARAQLAGSLHKIANKEAAIHLLLNYWEDENEYVRRLTLKSLFKLGYEKLHQLLLTSWEYNHEYERTMCLELWHQMNHPEFGQYLTLALSDTGKVLHDYAVQWLENGEEM